MKYLKALWNGELVLWKAFWIFGVAILFSLTLVFNFLLSALLQKNPAAGGLFIGIYIFIVFGYTILAYVGIWKSANNHAGFKLWGYAAKLWIILNALLLILSIFQMFSTDTDDPGKSSKNITEHLQPDDNYPYVGFWKRRCTNDFGLAINKVSEGLYSVSFCGPGGCFKPGTYRSNTSLVNDKDYRLIDEDTIEVNGKDGYSTYVRCE